MNPPASSFAPPRVAPHFGNALGGIWRLTLRRYLLPAHWISLAALCGLLVITALPSTSTAAAAKTGYLPWVISFYLCVIVPAMAFISAAGAIRDEMKAGNVDYVFTRPISRPGFLLAKLLSQVACAQIDFLLSFATVVGVGLYREFPDLWSAVPALLGGQILLVVAFSAFGFLAGIVTQRFIVVGLVYGAVIEVGVGQIPTQISRLSMTHQIRALLQAHLIPDPAAAATTAGAAVTAPPSALLTILTVLAFAAVMWTAAAAIFSLLELSGPNEA